MKKHFLFLLTLGLVLIIGCQKELSRENGNNPSEGSLQSDITGDCLPKTVNGNYVAGKALVVTTNTISVQVEVTKAGSYTLLTDTINGYYFKGTGIFPDTGSKSVTLSGIGTPEVEGVNNFVITYDSTVCAIAVTVLPGAIGPAAFTLTGSPSCSNPVIGGGYATGIPLNNLNTVTLNVNVTTIGSYNITTAATNGMTFSAQGTFTTPGVQVVVLTGSGTPVTGGNTTVPITAGSSTCSFVIPIGNPAVCTLAGAPSACTSFIINGIYVQSTALVATSNTVQVSVNVTTAGAYSITTSTVDGFSFAASGTFTSTGTKTVILIGTGTPANTGAQTFTATVGSSSCTFVITVVPIDYFPRTANSNWSYEYNDNPIDSFYRKAISLPLSALGNTYNIFMGDIGAGLDSAGYFRKSSTDYFQYFNVTDFIPFDNPIWTEYIFLKDAAVNTTWYSSAGGYTGTITTAPNPPQSLTLRFKYTIVQKDGSISLTTSTGTVNYNNVIIVDERYEQFTGGVWVDVTSAIGSGKSYYARNIGLIKYESFNPDGTLFEQMELRRFQIF